MENMIYFTLNLSKNHSKDGAAMKEVKKGVVNSGALTKQIGGCRG